MANKIRAPWEEHDREYRAFQERQDIPVHTGLYVEDVREVAVADWDLTGGQGAFINLTGMEGMCDLQVHQIPPGERLKPQRHLHDSLVFVVQGSGLTTIESEEEQTTFEWDDGALFYLPRNTEYVHSNATGDEPVLLLAQTSLPLLYSILLDDEVIWDVKSYDGWSKLAEEEGDFYSGIAEIQGGTDVQGRSYWNANFVPDAADFDQLATWTGRGEGNRSVHFPFPSTSMLAHISEFTPGRYKKAHRHICGANVLLLAGEGYSLLWQERDEERTRVDWGPYTLFTPPTMWFHQHFNTSEETARYVVLHAPTYRLGIRGKKGNNDAIAPWNPLNQIEYHEEDPEIREKFQVELDAEGIENEMPTEIYEETADSPWD